jgi:DNA-binding NarL/FixJ family response regulator
VTPDGKETIGVLLADDHGVVREGLAQLLSTAGDIEVVATARDGEEAAALAGELRPDVVLMDLSMPNVDGIEATRRIVEADVGAEVVVLTTFSDRARIVAALNAGAAGYMLKDVEPSELFDAIRAAARGESPIHPKAAREILSLRGGPIGTDGLTVREREVLGLVAAGMSNNSISIRLEISEKTVKGHLTSIFGQIGVTDRTQAALWAKEHGIL